jgi:hypothetical protein
VLNLFFGAIVVGLLAEIEKMEPPTPLSPPIRAMDGRLPTDPK